MARTDKIPVERFVTVMSQNAHLVRVEIEGNDEIVRKASVVKDIYPFEDGFINRKFVLRAANKFGVDTHLFF